MGSHSGLSTLSDVTKGTVYYCIDLLMSTPCIIHNHGVIVCDLSEGRYVDNHHNCYTCNMYNCTCTVYISSPIMKLTSYITMTVL